MPSNAGSTVARPWSWYEIGDRSSFPRQDAARDMRTFNIEGPVIPARHYCIPPLERLNLDEILELIRDMQYFVLHAPRLLGQHTAETAQASHAGGAGHRVATDAGPAVAGQCPLT